MSLDKNIGFLVFPGVTQLDVAIPGGILRRLAGYKLRLIWKNTGSIATDTGFSIFADTDFEDCPELDLLVVPGGLGQNGLMSDPEVLAFLQQKSQEVRYLASVGSGSRLLTAAGLLYDPEAASHWPCQEYFRGPKMRAGPRRVVLDGDRLTSSGVSALIDLGLILASSLESYDKVGEKMIT